MKHSVPHTLGKEAAQKAARSAFESYVQRFTEYGARATWTSEERAEIAFSVKGMTLKGLVEVKASSIDLDMEVPFLLRPFKDLALSKIEGEIRQWITKAERGEIT